MAIPGYTCVEDLKCDCPVCGKPDWCLLKDDGSAAVCQRISSDKKFGEAGHIHLINGKPTATKAKRKLSVQQLDNLWQNFYSRWHGVSNRGSILTLFGLANQENSEALVNITDDYPIGYDGTRLFFKFVDPHKHKYSPDVYERIITGIQGRDISGKKKMISGSSLGLFMPNYNWHEEVIVIAEGVSDTLYAKLYNPAAYVIGRPNAIAATKLLVKWFRSLNHDLRLLFLIDNDPDEAGKHGAENIIKGLIEEKVTGLYKCLGPKKHKDFREAICSGVTQVQYDKFRKTIQPRKLWQ